MVVEKYLLIKDNKMELTETEKALKKLLYSEIEKKINKDGLVRQIEQLNKTLEVTMSIADPKYNEAREIILNKILELVEKL